MRLDLSSVDAELESLGSAPEDAAALARTFAGIDTTLQQLQQIDRELGLLEAKIEWRVASSPANTGALDPAPAFAAAAQGAFGVESEPAPRAESEPAPAHEAEHAAGAESWPPLQHMESTKAAHSDSPTSAVHSVPPPALTQSQEIVLPDPIARDELSSESGELRLDDEKPSSGSFSLDVESPEPALRQPGAADLLKSPRLPSFTTDDVGDALEGSRPLSLGEPKAGAIKTPPFTFDRDPDAEFDALLSEATDPNGMPTDGATLEADQLANGLEDDNPDGEELHGDLASTVFPPATSDAQFREVEDELALLLLEDADSTEVLDRATLGGIEAQTPAIETVTPDAGAQDDTLTELSGELEMGELEIVMEETPTKAPPPPPPPATTGGEKRPSLLGRFFGRGDRE